MTEQGASLGIDLGGTNTKVGLLLGSNLLYPHSFPTLSYRPPEEVLLNIVQAVKDVTSKAKEQGLKVQTLGVGVPATIDIARGQTLIMPNFAEGWYSLSLVDYLKKKTGLATALVNDARAFVIAESTLGAAQAYEDVFGLILGTGVGGGVVLRGQVHTGRGALAGEIGHHIVDPFGLKCGCGSTGCLETVASAPALVASVMRAYLHGRSPVLLELTKEKREAIDAVTIAEAAREGDAACLDALNRVGFYLGIATANVMTLVAPECIVVGGGLVGASDLLFPAIKKTWQTHLQVVGNHQPELKRATLEHAGVVGAALFAQNAISSQKSGES